MNKTYKFFNNYLSLEYAKFFSYEKLSRFGFDLLFDNRKGSRNRVSVTLEFHKYRLSLSFGVSG